MDSLVPMNMYKPKLPVIHLDRLAKNNTREYFMKKIGKRIDAVNCPDIHEELEIKTRICSRVLDFLWDRGEEYFYEEELDVLKSLFLAAEARRRGEEFRYFNFYPTTRRGTVELPSRRDYLYRYYSEPDPEKRFEILCKLRE